MKKTKKSAWQDLEHNQILQGEGFYVSYNPNTGMAHAGLSDLVNMLGGDVTDGEETALYDGTVWRILSGDFRKEYEKAFAKGLDGCLEVYKKNIESRCNWSTD